MDISLKLALSIFGLNEKYSQSDINSAYRRLAKITHPDSGGDSNLFLFIKECKESLEKSINTNYSSAKTSMPPNSTQQNTVKYADIDLDLLYDEYNILDNYMEDFNIRDIVSNMYISIRPIFKNSLTKWKNYSLNYPFKYFLASNKKEILFKETIFLPKEFEKHKFLKVFVKIEEKEYHFYISPNSSRELSSLNAFKAYGDFDYFLTTLHLSFKTSI